MDATATGPATDDTAETSAPETPASWRLPDDGLLLHIGPHKTGSTALQGAMFAARADLLAQGVVVPAKQRHPISAVHAGIERRSPFQGSPLEDRRLWTSLVRELGRDPGTRAVISSESFADAKPDAIPRVVADLGADRVHVVVTLRPLARIITSQWQQYVQSGARVSLDTWLDAMLRQPSTRLTPSFWYRHRHEELVGRWAKVVGTDRVIVVVVDERDRAGLYRSFEAILGLREGTLVPVDNLSNRSMTMAEIEVIRAVNIAYARARLPRPLYAKVIRFGAARYMARTGTGEGARVEAPQWALDRAGEIGREIASGIAAAGVRVIGDLDALAMVPTSSIVGDRVPEVSIPPEVAASAAMGVLFASGLANPPDDGGRATVTHGRLQFEPSEVIGVSSRSLARVLYHRGRADLGRRVRRITRRG